MMSVEIRVSVCRVGLASIASLMRHDARVRPWLLLRGLYLATSEDLHLGHYRRLRHGHRRGGIGRAV